MKTMLSQLKLLNEDLYNSFKVSFEKAKTEWLPNVIPRKSSYNSFPHIMGVIEQADNLLFNGIQGCADIELNDIELYIMLNSILLHDIGRAILKIEDIKGVKLNKFERAWKDNLGHAEKSRLVVLHKWAELGIKTERIAEIISFIVLFHDPDYIEQTRANEDSKLLDYIVIPYQQKILNKLSYKTTVYSHGFVRSKLLATILYLADHLDNSYTRVPPEYIEEDPDIVGRFRKEIISTYYVKYSKMVCLEIKDELFLSNPILRKNISKIRETSDLLNFVDKISGLIKRKHEEEYKKLNKVDKEVREKIENEALKEMEDIVLKRIHKDELEEKLKDLILRDLSDNNPSTFQLICKSVLLNDMETKHLHRDLELMGIPIRQWFIEKQGLLLEVVYYKGKYRCKYAIEPILDLRYCLDVISAIVKLGTSIIGKRYHSYESIANYIHEDINDLEKVICAANRISRLFREYYLNPDLDYDCQIIINCDTEGWNIWVNRGNNRCFNHMKDVDLLRQANDILEDILGVKE